MKRQLKIEFDKIRLKFLSFGRVQRNIDPNATKNKKIWLKGTERLTDSDGHIHKVHVNLHKKLYNL